jgi:RNA polymerase sigma factor (sigma-70 family)
MAVSLLERIAAGDHTAVKDCMDVYGGLVWSLARRFNSSVADAEDATQEIFLEIWKSASRYDPSAGSEAVFITTIARRRLIDRLRAQKRRPQTEEFDEETVQTLSSDLDDAEPAGALLVEVEAAQRALAKLDPAQREVLLLGVVQGLTHSEIATKTGKPLGTVKTHMRRGLIKIRELIGAESSEAETR